MASIHGLTSGATVINQINLSWDPSSDATSYNIYWSNSLNGDFSKINFGPVTTTDYSDFYDLAPETTYYYKVTAENSVSESEKSDVVAVTTPSPTPDDYANSMDAAGLISEGTIVPGVIDYVDDFIGDLDYFRFTPINSGRYVIKSSGTTNVEGFLLDSNEELLAYDSDYDESQFKITYNLLAGEPYYLMVSGYETGPYDIQVNLMHPIRGGASYRVNSKRIGQRPDRFSMESG